MVQSILLLSLVCSSSLVQAFPGLTNTGLNVKDGLSGRAAKASPGFPGFPSFPSFPKLPGIPGFPAPAACPQVWFQVSSDLTEIFKDNSTGQCNDAARAAIRAAFHDTATYSQSAPVVPPASGGADGSLILAQEYNRPENNGLQAISATLLGIAQNRGVGVADLIQFAGAHATATCPLGPHVPVVVGRQDSSTPSAEGLVPSPSESGDQLLGRFEDMGLNAEELAALIGAHTCAKQFFVDTSLAGEPLDDTPGIWDVDFYSDVGNTPQGVFVLQSDKALSQQAEVGPHFDLFINDQIGWDAAFALAMAKLSVVGIPTGSSGLIDCTVALPF